jgi:hypothetical protein
MYDDVCIEEYINIYPGVSQGTHSSFTAHPIGSIFYHCIYGCMFCMLLYILYAFVCFVCFCMFCMLLFNFVLYVFLLLCLYMLIIMYVLFLSCQLTHFGYTDWGFSVLVPQLLGKWQGINRIDGERLALFPN